MMYWRDENIAGNDVAAGVELLKAGWQRTWFLTVEKCAHWVEPSFLPPPRCPKGSNPH